jgi:[ribosomal protein S18]-alanine N-acetyltransferase
MIRFGAIRIRLIREEDLPVVRAWMNGAPGAPAWSDDDLAAVVKAASADQHRLRTGWVAEQTGSGMAGFAVATGLSIPGTPAECELEFVLVHPQVRRRGIGAMLVHAALNWARDLGADEIRLEVRESNTGAVQLYERCGFVLAGRRAAYFADPPEDALLMRRKLGC